jgi:hypothetical protein
VKEKISTQSWSNIWRLGQIFFPYNIIIGQPTFNVLGVALWLSTLYLSMKYPLSNDDIGVVKNEVGEKTMSTLPRM